MNFCLGDNSALLYIIHYTVEYSTVDPVQYTAYNLSLSLCCLWEGDSINLIFHYSVIH